VGVGRVGGAVGSVNNELGGDSVGVFKLDLELELDVVFIKNMY
jgi:hypothetical protein